MMFQNACNVLKIIIAWEATQSVVLELIILIYIILILIQAIIYNAMKCVISLFPIAKVVIKINALNVSMDIISIIIINV